MMKTLRLLFLLMLAVAMTNCSKDDADEPMDSTDDDISMPMDDDEPAELSGANELTDFSILMTANPNLNIDADVQQNGTNYKLFVPAGTNLTDLVPTFQVSDKATLSINGTEVASGSTAVDLSAPSTITVTAENGDTNEFSLVLEGNFIALDDAIDDLRLKYTAPGFQVAITKNEKLVYSNYYGFANIVGTELVTNESVFRVGAISTTITAITILRMAVDGLLTFDDTVFGADGILEFDYGTAPYGPNIENITIRHLIGHTSGWTNSPNDPLFVNFNQDISQVIDNMLDNRPLETIPGENFSYSAFGYTVLGRVIEKISGMGYEEYVRQNVLNPIGISDMNIAGNTIEDKLPNEVEYLGQETFSPYEFNINRTDAAFGWTASATELAKIMVALDGNPEKPDLFTPELLEITAWGVEQWGSAGSLPGTSAYMWKLDSETNFVILTNTRTLPIADILNEMTDTMFAEILDRTSWPEYDLFEVQ